MKPLYYILIIGILYLNGCAYIKHIRNLDSEPIYITAYRGYPPIKEVSFGNRGKIDFESLDDRIDNYLNSHPEIDKSITNQMKNYAVCKGMTKEQVATIAIPDTKEFAKGKSEENWIYGSVMRDGRMVKITFIDDLVAQINVKYWTYTFVE